MTPEPIAWVQAIAAIVSMIATVVLAFVAIPALLAARRQAEAGKKQADGALEQAVAGKAQAEAGARQVLESERQRLLAAMPVVGVRSYWKTGNETRTFLTFELACESPTPAFSVRTLLTPMSDQRTPFAGARSEASAQVPILGPGQTHPVSIEVSSYSNSEHHVGYSWMEVTVECLGILGARVSASMEFAPNDAVDKPPGTPGYGQRFTFRRLEADLDGTGRHRLVVSDDGASGLQGPVDNQA